MLRECVDGRCEGLVAGGALRRSRYCCCCVFVNGACVRMLVSACVFSSVG